MRIVAPLLVALCLAFTGPALAQNDGEAPPERQTSPDGRLQAIDENGNPLFDPAGGPVWELSDVERALQLFEEAVAGSRGLASGSGAWFSVATALKEAVELAPEFHEARYNLGLAFYEMNDLEGARIELDKVVDARPDLVGARVALGLVMEGEGRLNDAEMLYALGLQDAPRNVDLLNGQARVLLKKGRANDAERAVKAILRINSNSIDAFNTLGLAYLAMERFETARFVFQKAKSLPGGDTNASLEANLGLVYWKMGKEFQAEASFRAALKTDPNHPGARVNLAHLRLVNLDYEGALELLRTVKDRLKGDETVQLSYAVAARGTGKFDEAERIYREIAADPDSELRDDALLNLGILQGDFLKDLDAAIDTYNEYIAVRETMGDPVGDDELVLEYLEEVKKLKKKRDRRRERDAEKAKEKEKEAEATPEPAPEPAPEEGAEPAPEEDNQPPAGEGE